MWRCTKLMIQTSHCTTKSTVGRKWERCSHLFQAAAQLHGAFSNQVGFGLPANVLFFWCGVCHVIGAGSATWLNFGLKPMNSLMWICNSLNDLEMLLNCRWRGTPRLCVCLDLQILRLGFRPICHYRIRQKVIGACGINQVSYNGCHKKGTLHKRRQASLVAKDNSWKIYFGRSAVIPDDEGSCLLLFSGIVLLQSLKTLPALPRTTK